MIRIVIPTQKTEEEYTSSVQYKCIQKIVQNCDTDTITITPFYKNTIGLSELYNKIIREYTKSDYIIFMHDDVEIHDLWFVEKIKKAHEFYDIVGVAGAINQDYTKGKPTVWHLSMENRGDSRGIVSHYILQGFNGCKNTHYNSAYFGETPSEVVVIDGLLMSVKVSSLDKMKEELFDNDMEFHHYDMSMCVRAKRNGLTIGIWPIFLVHHGMGEWANQEAWKKTDNIFKQRYGNVRTDLINGYVTKEKTLARA